MASSRRSLLEYPRVLRGHQARQIIMVEKKITIEASSINTINNTMEWKCFSFEEFFIIGCTIAISDKHFD